MATIPIILNPIAGGGRLLGERERLDQAARECGQRLEWWFTEYKGHGRALAAKAAEQGRDLVIAFGGDGSYAEVAEGLVGSSTALGALSGGTVSVLIDELGLPRSPSEALKALVNGVDRDLYLGRTDAGEVVLLMISAGLDAMVLERLRPALKRHLGRYGIGVQAVFELLSGRPLPVVEVVVAGRRETGSWVIVGNCQRYAGNYKATPGADPFKPGFEVVLERAMGRFAAIGFALALARGRHLSRSSVVAFKTDEVELRAVQGRVRYQLDGDLAGKLPVKVTSESVPVHFRVPNTEPR